MLESRPFKVVIDNKKCKNYRYSSTTQPYTAFHRQAFYRQALTDILYLLCYRGVHQAYYVMGHFPRHSLMLIKSTPQLSPFWVMGLY
jgi:hypothetical protein